MIDPYTTGLLVAHTGFGPVSQDFLRPSELFGAFGISPRGEDAPRATKVLYDCPLHQWAVMMNMIYEIYKDYDVGIIETYLDPSYLEISIGATHLLVSFR